MRMICRVRLSVIGIVVELLSINDGGDLERSLPMLKSGFERFVVRRSFYIMFLWQMNGENCYAVGNRSNCCSFRKNDLRCSHSLLWGFCMLP